MTISREAMRHNLQMIADGEPIHVGAKGLLQKGEGDQTRVQEVVDQTLAAICETENQVYVSVIESGSVRFVNAGHLQERIRSVTSHVFNIPPAEINSEFSDGDFKREVRIASGNGHLEVVHFLLSEGRELSQEGLDNAVEEASSNGHLKVVHFLLSEGRELSQEGLDGAVQEASWRGNLKVARFLLSEGRALSQEGLDDAVKSASANGHLEVVHFLLSEGRELSQKGLDCAVESAASWRGNLKVARFLLSEGRELSQEGLDYAVKSASRNGRLEEVNFLLSGGRELSHRGLDYAVEAASSDGHLEVVRFLLSEGQELSQKGLDNAVEEASNYGHLKVVRFLLSEGRTLSQRGFDNAVLVAVRYVEVLLFLLSQGTVAIRIRNEIALISSYAGYPDSLEAMLQNGPIYQSTLGSCRTQATRNENRQRILDLLDSAPVIPDPTLGASAAPLAGGTSLTLSDVKVHPQTYLDQLAAYGMPRRVTLADNPQAIDLGGVTKQYLTTLFGALLEKHLIRIDNEGTPSTERDQDKELLQKVGQAFSHIAKRNSPRTDKFLVGELFSERFYKLVHMVAANKEGLFEAALEGSIYVEMDEPADYIEPQIEAAKCFCAGLDDATKALFAANENLQEAFQGQPCTKEALLAAIRFSDMSEQEAWIREMIEGSDQQWRQRFVFALTGNKTLAPGLKLEVRRGWRPVFELHTCFNSLDVPADMAKEDFIAGVNASLIGEDYNIG